MAPVCEPGLQGGQLGNEAANNILHIIHEWIGNTFHEVTIHENDKKGR